MLLPVEWPITAKVIRKTSRKVFSVSLGRKASKKTWWSEEVLECIQRKVSKEAVGH